MIVRARGIARRLKGSVLPKSREDRSISIFPLHRLEGLTDGIYAISMTLLVLSLPMPEPGAQSETNWGLLAHIMDLDDVFQSFVVSFMVLGVMWITQQKLFRRLRSTCTTHLWASLGGLMMICLIPYSAMLNGEYGDLFISNCFFHVNIFVLSVFLALQWGAALNNPEIVEEGVGEKAVRRGLRVSLVLPVLALVGIALAVFWPSWSTLVYAVTPFAIAKVKDRNTCDDQPAEVE